MDALDTLLRMPFAWKMVISLALMGLVQVWFMRKQYTDMDWIDNHIEDLVVTSNVLQSATTTPPTPTSKFPQPQPVDWEQRVSEKRKWLDMVQASLPRAVIHKKRKGMSRANVCREVANGTKDSWVIHRLDYSLDATNQNQTTRTTTTATNNMVQEEDPQTSAPAPTKSQPQPRHRHHRHAIVIPYRDRAYHLERFLKYMSMYFKYHYPQPNVEDRLFPDQQEPDREFSNHSFALYIVEQADTELFNRALLMNVGLDHVSSDTECIVQHDVDLVPGFFAQVPYHNCTKPTHLATRPENYNFTIYYPTFVGAVMAMHQQHWAAVNGMDNQLQGWGGEDDDLYVRLAFMGLVDCTKDPNGEPFRPSEQDTQGVFTAISEKSHNHQRGAVIAEAKKFNRARYYSFLFTGKSPTVTASGGWRQTRYHVVNRTSWDLSNRPSLQGFAEIHHIQVKVDKASMEKCYTNCESTVETSDKPTNDTLQPTQSATTPSTTNSATKPPNK